MQYAVPLHPDYFASSLHDPYLAPNDAHNYTTGFSRGSSLAYPHPDYRYLPDRGELASRLCASSLVGSTLDATGLGFAGNSLVGPTAFAAPEDISIYNHHTWDWTAAAAAAPSGAPDPAIIPSTAIYSLAPQDDFFAISKPSADLASAVCSPAPQLPTPAAMAVLLNPTGRSEGEQQQQPGGQSGYEIPLSSSALVAGASRSSATAIRPSRLVEQAVATQEVSPMVPETLSREKKHACTMCHKRFDRPSTLRKHLLVHTGEKAFVCETCGRRFGVASNLNRHVKRCVLKPANTPSPSNKSSPPSPSAMDAPVTPTPNSTGTPISPTALASARSRRPRVEAEPPTSSSSSVPQQSTSGPSTSTVNYPAPQSPTTRPSRSSRTAGGGQKRRRRAPSPSQWIPATLQHFNLLSEDSYRVTTLPLPPVRRNYPKEERDSWDENIGHAPYHPCGWTGILPGPGLGHGIGLGGKDVRNLNLGGRGGTVLGRVLVF